MLRRFIVVAAVAMAASVFMSAAAEAQGGTPPPSVRQAEAFVLSSRPFIRVDYGFTTPQFKDAGFDFAGIGLLEFKVGYSAMDSVHTSAIEMWDTYLFYGFANDGMGSSGAADAVGSEFNRFGGGSTFAKGYQGKSVGLDLSNVNSLHWTKFSAADYDAAVPEAQDIFDRYGTNYRFGHLMEAGLKFRFAGSLGLSAGLEGSIIYPRYVFWPWLGSFAMYSVVQSAVEYFSDQIVEASPGIGPVIYWLLKSGVSYGYYAMSRGDMNWPFDSETPVTLETFKLAATFSF